MQQLIISSLHFLSLITPMKRLWLYSPQMLRHFLACRLRCGHGYPFLFSAMALRFDIGNPTRINALIPEEQDRWAYIMQVERASLYLGFKAKRVSLFDCSTENGSSIVIF